MTFLNPKRYYELMYEKGYRPSWLAHQIGVTYGYMNLFMNGKKPLAKHRIEKLHKILVGEE